MKMNQQKKSVVLRRCRQNVYISMCWDKDERGKTTKSLPFKVKSQNKVSKLISEATVVCLVFNYIEGI